MNGFKLLGVALLVFWAAFNETARAADSEPPSEDSLVSTIVRRPDMELLQGHWKIVEGPQDHGMVLTFRGATMRPGASDATILLDEKCDPKRIEWRSKRDKTTAVYRFRGDDKLEFCFEWDEDAGPDGAFVKDKTFVFSRVAKAPNDDADDPTAVVETAGRAPAAPDMPPSDGGR